MVAFESSGEGCRVCQVSVITVMSNKWALIAFIIYYHLRLLERERAFIVATLSVTPYYLGRLSTIFCEEEISICCYAP